MTIGSGYFKRNSGVPYRSEKVLRQVQQRYRRSLSECTLTCVSMIQWGHLASDGCMGNSVNCSMLLSWLFCYSIVKSSFHGFLQCYRGEDLVDAFIA